jgi:hypothetical protein
MQFDPDRYPVKDFKFVPLSTMGMVAREYEQQQLVGLMQTLGPTSPITPVLLQGIIQSSSLSNRDDIIAQLQKMSQPDPQAQQVQQQMQHVALATAEAGLQKTQAEAALAQANAAKATAQTQVIPIETQIKAVSAQSKNQPPSPLDQVEKVANLALKEADIKSNERIAMIQMASKVK